MPNLSLFAIPAYWVLTMAPHSYAVAIMSKANNGKWDNSNPRSSTWDNKLRTATPAEAYGRYERAEAAHKNGFENLPLFVGAILAGNLAGLSSVDLNRFTGAYLAMRALYTLVYVNVTRNSTSFFRTAIWLASTMGCMAVYVKSGIALM
ncbi:hypothetical protein BJ875DRAFT_457433 [Amylocarpus encephaloides]|uniref:Glutathione transferase n=1 Tax=Amylocarpus encephaloides TaxID=45428 RepID=A0A9P7YLT9_9HELO|nr:hypothetical protein BJ875DRAFT_457433 [Amylocarpus encephaloides]